MCLCVCQVMKRNVARLTKIVQSAQQITNDIVDCLDWRSKFRSCLALIVLNVHVVVVVAAAADDDDVLNTHTHTHTHTFYCHFQLDMGRVHPWVGLGRVGSGSDFFLT